MKKSGMMGRLLRGPVPPAIAGSLFAATTANYRSRLRRDTRRLRLLADVAQVAHIGQTAPDIAQAISDLLVPGLVDICVIDVIGGNGKLQRLAGALNGDPELLRAFLARPPSLPGARAASATAVLPGTVTRLEEIDDDLRRQAAHDDEDFRLLQRLAVESALTVPLVGRDLPIGVVILGTRAPRRRLTKDDVEFIQTLAGRIALALDNAALSLELSSTERQLEVILETVDAAITVRDTYGRMVYANQAAADLLNLPDPEAVKSQPPGQLMERFDVYTEEGDLVDLADLPGTRLLGGEASPPQLVVRNVVKETGEERWLLNKATAVTDAEGKVLMAVNLIEDVTETKRSEIAQRLLATTARELAEAADLSKTLGAIADAAVPGLADWAGVDLVSPSGEITTVAVSHRDPKKVRLGWHLRNKWPVDPDEPEGMAAVIRTGEPQLIRDISDEMLVRGAHDQEHLEVLRAVGLTSTMIAPIQAGAHRLGTLSFVSSTSRRFDERDLALACDLGRQAGIFISNAQLHAEQAHIAQTLQAGLIPESLHQPAGWQVASAYRAAGLANEVGGDFYDIIRFDGGWAAVVGDVVGKGAQAAALTALARHTLAAIIESTGDAGHALTVLNRRLRTPADDLSSLCTIAAVVITDDQHATFFSAGHPLPLLGRDGSVTFAGTTSSMLGFAEEVEVAPTRMPVLPGDEIVLYTDGVTDAVGSSERFGEQRLLETVQRALGDGTMSPAEAVIAAIDDFLAGDQNDDIAIIGLTRSPVTAAAAAAAVDDSTG